MATRKMGPPLLPAHPVRCRCIWTQKHICPVGCQNSTILLELSELCVGSPQHPHLCHPLDPPPAGKRPKLKGTSPILEPCQSRIRKTKYYVLPKPVVLQPECAEESPGNWFNLWSFEAFLQRFWVSRSLDKVSVWPVFFKPGGMLESWNKRMLRLYLIQWDYLGSQA